MHWLIGENAKYWQPSPNGWNDKIIDRFGSDLPGKTYPDAIIT